jgi:lysophospholipid acyltransferase (LPLAT)-like uncharacterized protein
VRYRVDNVPIIISPFWLVYSWVVGLSIWIFLVVLQATCKIRIQNHIDGYGQRNFVYSLWHRFWFLWAVSFVRSHRRHAWLQHPAAYMKPIHIGLKLMKIRVLLGSGGEEGRRAAKDLVNLLRKGWSTVISPDGPQGPQGVLKKGVLHISMQSGVPILPVRFIAHRTFALPSWDKKLLPLPLSKVTVVFGEPITVNESNFEEAARLLEDRMTNN